MMTREIIIDTETTGLRAKDGHRIIEVAAIELDGLTTGRMWHSYFSPGRAVDAGAIAVHGITNTKLEGAPRFAVMVDEFLSFVEGASLIAHNAPFDMGFLDAELARCNKQKSWANVIDTLPMARKRIPGKRHRLDDLCDHFGISRSARKLHGATLDAMLLARVYCFLTGRHNQLDLHDGLIAQVEPIPHPGPRPIPLPPRITEEEERAHQAFMASIRECANGCHA
jgi:DNA polymerase III subunit epsilon